MDAKKEKEKIHKQKYRAQQKTKLTKEEMDAKKEKAKMVDSRRKDNLKTGMDIIKDLATDKKG